MIRSLNQQGVVEEAVGYVAEAVDKGAKGVIVIHIPENGKMMGHAFGEITYVDIAYSATFLNKRVMDHMDGVE